MLFVILFVSSIFEICQSSILFRIESKIENVSLNSAYFLGTVHVAQKLIWPYFSKDTLDILNNSDEYWVEMDPTDPLVRMYINRCIIDQLLPKQLARLRVETWPRFLNDIKRNHPGRRIQQ